MVGTRNVRSRTTLLAFVWITAAVSAQEPAARGESAGTVVTLDGLPVAGISVQVYRDASVEKTLVTDAQGRFPVPDAWWVEAERNSAPVQLIARDGDRRLGWFDFSHQAAERRRKQVTRTPLVSGAVQITLLPCERVICGRLVRPDGLPAADVAVQVTNLSREPNGALHWDVYEAPVAWPLPQTLSDRDGRFEVRTPEQCWLRFRTYHPDWATRAISPGKKPDLGQVELSPAGKVTGCVSDSRTGKPMPGVRIVARGAARRGGGRGTTGADGRYSIGGLEADYCSVQVETVAAHPQLVAPVQDPLQIEAGKESQLDFAIREGVRISGRVVEAVTGEPLPEASVWCQITKVPEQSAISVSRRTWVDAEGRFEVCVPPGICKLSPYGGRRQTVDGSSRTIEVGQTPPDPIVLRLGPEYTPGGGFLGGGMGGGIGAAASPPPSRPRVTVELRSQAGPPLGDFIVRQVYQGRNHVAEWSIKNGTKFEKEFSDNEVGRSAFLLVDVPGFAQARSPDFVIGANMPPLVIDLPPAVYVPIQGRVVDRDGRPLAKAHVRVRRIVFGADVEFPWGPEAVSGEDGRFTVKYVRLGDQVVLRVDREDIGRTETEPILVSQADPISLPDVVLRVADQVVSGIVTDQDGFPVAGVIVEHLAEGRRWTQTDATGRFLFDRLSAGRLTLSLQAIDGSQAKHTVVAGSRDVRLFLPVRSQYDRPENLLTINLRTNDGKTPAEAEYFVLDVQRRRWLVSGGFSGRTTASCDLRFTLRRFPEDQLAVVVVARDYALPAPVAVVTSPKIEPVTVTLEPAPAVKLTGRVIDAASQPVAGAGVGLSRMVADGIQVERWKHLSNMPDKVPQTGADGRFEFPGLPRGLPVAVYANKAGYAGVWSARITPSGMQGATLPDLRLAKATRTLSGRVVGQNDKPVAGARVLVHDFARPETKSDASGRFQLQGVPDGELLVVASAPGYEDGSQMVSVEAAARDMVLHLVPDPWQYFPPR